MEDEAVIPLRPRGAFPDARAAAFAVAEAILKESRGLLYMAEGYPPVLCGVERTGRQLAVVRGHVHSADRITLAIDSLDAATALRIVQLLGERL